MKTTIETNLQNPDFRRHFAEEGFVVECMERVCEWMEREDVSRAELARRLGTSRANVTQMLAGRNVSLRTLAGVAHVLGGIPDFRIIGEPSVVTRAPRLKLIDCGARYARSGTTQWLVQHADETCTIVVGSARDAENLRLTHAPRANVENIHTDIRFPGIEARNPAKFDPGIDNPTSLARIRGLILFDTDAIWALVREHEQLEVRAARAEAALNEAESRAARAEAAARRAKERLAEVAAQLPAKNLRAWRVCQVSDDAQETISNPKHTPLLIAATPREAVESWFAQTNPPTTSTVRLYVSEYRDSPVELWRVHLAFLDGNWHGSVELA